MIKITVDRSRIPSKFQRTSAVALKGLDILKSCKTPREAASLVPWFAEINQVSQTLVIRAINRIMGLSVDAEMVRDARIYYPTWGTFCPKSSERDGDDQKHDLIRWDRIREADAGKMFVVK